MLNIRGAQEKSKKILHGPNRGENHQSSASGLKDMVSIGLHSGVVLR